MEKTSSDFRDFQYRKTSIPELDAFIEAEIGLIGGEENKEEQTQLWRILWNGIRAILTAQLQLPANDDATSSERVNRRINIIKQFLEGMKHD